ncbi:MGH1-like glycoside hydrolase domain-containing protein [Parapedobacter tibetensis]|uniref:MGH1-like glycoside hydrolase domain-containing protein n=1 Tax=Parapedobacter tibetensis TaxID=2972951 RepID=UPI00214DF02E|nr:glycosyl hydrolase family 65 protein [Parapedobacter tibetensis]
MKSVVFFALMYLIVGFSLSANAQENPYILNVEILQSHVESFNVDDAEHVVNLISNDQSLDWLASNIPLFECPDDKLTEVYYYRWWSFRKHLKETPQGFIFTEFITPVKHDGPFNSISCALGHHIYEGRWLKNTVYIDQYIDFWLKYEQKQPDSKFHNFSNWLSDAVYNYYLVKRDTAQLTALLPLLDTEYQHWVDTRSLDNGLFWQHDVKDGMEESVSGGRREKNARPTINSYMYGNAVALQRMAAIVGNQPLAQKYKDEANRIKRLVDENLWDSAGKSYRTKLAADSSLAPREAIGFIPWYFNMVDDRGEFAKAWSQVMDTMGFKAPWGLTTAERREPTFRTRGSGHGCEWDGALWPFASTQTLKALANLLSSYKHHGDMTKALYYEELRKYAESHQKDGKLYLGEYQDEVTGEWLKGDNPRSEFYNHSGFIDLIINDLIGLKPNDEGKLVLKPLVPKGKWKWFCLDQVPYQGKLLTVLWDEHGNKYGKGKGLRVFADGKQVAFSEKLTPISVDW